jgi:hypothetical protein
VSTSSFVVQEIRNDIAGVNLKSGPALIAINDWPMSSNETMSVSPDGVSWIVVTLVTLESGSAEE